MSNPIDDAFAEIKEAGPLDQMRSALQGAGHTLKRFGQEAVLSGGKATGAAGAAALVGGAALGIQKLVASANKRNEFEQMMHHNGDLVQYQEENPQFFNQAYTSLRSMIPQYAHDPLVSGAVMRRMVQDPQTSGSVLMSLLRPPSPTPSGPLSFVSGRM